MRALTVIKHPKDAQKIRVYAKGAPELINEMCSHIISENG